MSTGFTSGVLRRWSVERLDASWPVLSNAVSSPPPCAFVGNIYGVVKSQACDGESGTGWCLGRGLGLDTLVLCFSGGDGYLLASELNSSVLYCKTPNATKTSVLDRVFSIQAAVSQGRRHDFESGEDIFASRASQKIFWPPTFWPVGGGTKYCCYFAVYRPPVGK